LAQGPESALARKLPRHMSARDRRQDGEMTGLLELPLCDAESGEDADGRAASSSTASSDSEAGPRVAERLAYGVLDIVASVAFWYVLLFLYIPLTWFYCCLGVLVLAMVAYRIYRAHVSPVQTGVEIPYTCGFTANKGKELFLVATIHISPRAPRDVEAVINSTKPDIAMIELDEERLDRMRDDEVEQPQEPKLEDLQPIRINTGRESMTVHAQRALWNAERSGETISGQVVYDEDNAYGLSPHDDEVKGCLALVQRGSPAGEFAPFALKAHRAASSGAGAVLVINQEARLPVNRIGGGSMMGDLKVAFHTCSCGFPPIPVLLLPQEDGNKLRELCDGDSQAGKPSAEFEILADSYPRRTLRRRLCQAIALMGTGIGILYGIIQCCSVEVGAEFLAAEIAATARGISCVCIDVDLNRFWSRLGSALLPTPCNLGRSLLAWLAFPRVFFRILFPARGSVDVLGSMVLHAASFPLRTWAAFILAGFCASTVTSKILELIGSGAERAGEETGVVKEEDRDAVQAWIMLGIEMYMLPQIYDAVAASRDEAMYQSIVAKAERHNSKRMVVVVGAGHANGILERTRTRGL